MAHVLIVLGTVLVLLTLVDTFFTVLNYNDRGLFFNRAISLNWRLSHRAFGRLSYPKRRAIYRAMTGGNLLVGIVLWVLGIVVGFACIYAGAYHLGLVEGISKGSSLGLQSLYFSIAQFSTVGGSGLTPKAPWLGVVTVVETLLSVVFLSLVITYLVNVFNSIESLRTYCACFPGRTDSVTDPLADVKHYLPQQDPYSLEAHLTTVRSSMNAYFDSIAADHSAIYFYSGKDRFLMPFPVFMTAGLIETLAWGVPGGYPGSKLPELQRLADAFEGCRQQIYTLFRWDDPAQVRPVSPEDFRRVGEADRLELAHTLEQKYAIRFWTMRRRVAEACGNNAHTSWQEDYETYLSWLQFVVSADDFIRQGSQLFDYQPQVLRAGLPAVPTELYGWASS